MTIKKSEAIQFNFLSILQGKNIIVFCLFYEIKKNAIFFKFLGSFMIKFKTLFIIIFSKKRLILLVFYLHKVQILNNRKEKAVFLNWVNIYRKYKNYNI